MIMLTDEAVLEFQDLYSEEIDKNLNFEQAKSKATNFIRLFNLVLKASNENKKFKNEKQ